MVNPGPLVAQIAVVTGDPKNCGKFYKHLFETAPQVKQYFTKYDLSNLDKLPDDPFWQKQGAAVMAKLKELVEASTDAGKFSTQMAAFYKRHSEVHKVSPAVLAAVPDIVAAFVKTLGAEPDAGWGEFFKMFLEEGKKFGG